MTYSKKFKEKVLQEYHRIQKFRKENYGYKWRDLEGMEMTIRSLLAKYNISSKTLYRWVKKENKK